MSDPVSNKSIRKTKSRQKWRCEKCSFDNTALLDLCQICENPRNEEPASLDHPIQKSEIKNKDDAVVICTNKKCEHPNSLFNQRCEKCLEILIPDYEEQIKRQAIEGEKLISCKSCAFQNSSENQYCLNCEEPLNSIIPIKSIKRARPKRTKYVARSYPRAAVALSNCELCGIYLPIGITGLPAECPNCQKDDGLPVQKQFCNFCFEKLPPSKSEEHEGKCEERIKFFNTSRNQTFARCTQLQIQVMLYMHKKSQRLHYRKAESLKKRIKTLGYKAEQLQNLHHYIVNYAPIIIHMHVNTHFNFFLKDTHYRNQFQTAKSSGCLSKSTRTSWEDRMFDKKMHDATGFQRVKYGTMNFTNDPKGVRACSGYGQSYFLLKSHVRDRCTITDMDSSSPSAAIGTFRFCYHVLNKLSDAELKAAFEGSKAMQSASNVIGTYKQIQIHGPVQFAKDIERVYVSKDELKMGKAEELLDAVKQFCKNNKIEYQLFEQDKTAMTGFHGFGVMPKQVEKVPERFVGGKDQLKAEDLVVPAPVVSFGFGGFGSYIYPSVPSRSIFAVPPLPKKVVKEKKFGVDYI